MEVRIDETLPVSFFEILKAAFRSAPESSQPPVDCAFTTEHSENKSSKHQNRKKCTEEVIVSRCFLPVTHSICWPLDTGVTAYIIDESLLFSSKSGTKLTASRTFDPAGFFKASFDPLYPFRYCILVRSSSRPPSSALLGTCFNTESVNVGKSTKIKPSFIYTEVLSSLLENVLSIHESSQDDMNHRAQFAASPFCLLCASNEASVVNHIVSITHYLQRLKTKPHTSYYGKRRKQRTSSTSRGRRYRSGKRGFTD